MGTVTVGRDDVLARLRSLTTGTAAGTGRFALLTGPAGIGKTTMLAAAAEMGAAAGVRPAWGFFHPGEGAPAFSAWRQVARDLGVAWPEPVGGGEAGPAPPTRAPDRPMRGPGGSGCGRPRAWPVRSRGTSGNPTAPPRYPMRRWPAPGPTTGLSGRARRLDDAAERAANR